MRVEPCRWRVDVSPFARTMVTVLAITLYGIGCLAAMLIIAPPWPVH